MTGARELQRARGQGRHESAAKSTSADAFAGNEKKTAAEATRIKDPRRHMLIEVIALDGERQVDFAYDIVEIGMISACACGLASSRINGPVGNSESSNSELHHDQRSRFHTLCYCPACKTGIRIKNEKMIGTTIHCPNARNAPKSSRRNSTATSLTRSGDVELPPRSECKAPRNCSKFSWPRNANRNGRRQQKIKYAIELIGILQCWLLRLHFYQKIYVEGYADKPQVETKKFGKRIGGS